MLAAAAFHFPIRLWKPVGRGNRPRIGGGEKWRLRWNVGP